MAPPDFWRLSVREWLWLTKPLIARGLDRAGLTALMTLYPDREYDTFSTS
ncbi:MAG: phage tail assembly chaperone [Pseudomonadota bacterium]